jgi:hypothetical protein
MMRGGSIFQPRITTFTKADVTAAPAWNTGALTIFTITGDVILTCWGAVTTALTSTGNTGTLALGVSGATTTLIGTTTVDGTKLHTAKFVWADTAAASLIVALPGTSGWYAVSGTNVILTVATNNMTAGGMTIYCAWLPISAGASVV